MRDWRIFDEDLTYFLTPTVVEWLPLFTRPNCKKLIVDSLNYCIDKKGLIVYGWVLMPDHLHVLAKSPKGIKLSGILRDFKRFTALSLFDLIQNKSESRKSWMNWICKNHKYVRIEKNENFKIWQGIMPFR